MKKTQSAALLLLLSFSVICQAQTSTRRFVVEIKQDQDTGSPDQFFSDIADTNGYAGCGLLPDVKPPGSGYGLKTPLIESISWQWLCATNLLVAYELVLTTNAVSGFKPYSWLTSEVFVAVGWLLKGYWNPDSPLFNSIERLEAIQDDPFAITTMTLPGQNQNGQQQSQPSASSGQQASGATTSTHLTGSNTCPLPSGSGGGQEDPEKRLHTFGINCHVGFCSGVCILRPSLDNSELVEGPLNSEESSADETGSTPGRSSVPPFSVEDIFRFPIRNDLPTQVHREEPRLFLSALRSMNAEAAHTPLVCDEMLTTMDGERRPCGVVRRNAEMMLRHTRTHHTGPQFCDVIMVGSSDNDPRLCGRIFYNVHELSRHIRCHGRSPNRWRDRRYRRR
ncbi:hypothetical protein [Endozoicomonas sp. SESOKO2]|uniref:hypothetical protein n=1 Tax=Endozoicomonas sp. SESOKO2 TaxID=2828743 RepID=UPI0021475C1D|nr:hypothetical protein [Endozoicomonas sp. SESOKO2]